MSGEDDALNRLNHPFLLSLLPVHAAQLIHLAEEPVHGFRPGVRGQGKSGRLEAAKAEDLAFELAQNRVASFVFVFGEPR